MSRRHYVILCLAILALSFQVPLFGACCGQPYVCESDGFAATALGLTTLGQSPVFASIPGPECGPTRQWHCVIPECPECREILFEGTVCEKNQYEKQTGRVCSPA